MTDFWEASLHLGCPPSWCSRRGGRGGTVVQPARPSSPPRCVLAGLPECKTHGNSRDFFTSCQLQHPDVVIGRTSCRSWILVSSTCCMWSISCCLSWQRLCSSASFWLVTLSAVVLLNRHRMLSSVWRWWSADVINVFKTGTFYLCLCNPFSKTSVTLAYPSDSNCAIICPHPFGQSTTLSQNFCSQNGPRHSVATSPVLGYVSIHF